MWDVRKLTPYHAYGAASSVDALDISQRGLLAVGWGRRVQVWSDALATKAGAPLLNHRLDPPAPADAAAGLAGGAGSRGADGLIHSLRFCPYEDVLGVGHAGGFSTMLVPGAGEPNPDAWAADPFQSAKARREHEVKALLDKIPAEAITRDADAVGSVRRPPASVQAERAREAKEARQARTEAQREKADARTKKKGKNRPGRRHQRKQQANVVTDRDQEVRDRVRAGGADASHLSRLDREARDRREARRAEVERASTQTPDGRAVPLALRGLYKSAMAKAAPARAPNPEEMARARGEVGAGQRVKGGGGSGSRKRGRGD